MAEKSKAQGGASSGAASRSSSEKSSKSTRGGSSKGEAKSQSKSNQSQSKSSQSQGKSSQGSKSESRSQGSGSRGGKSERSESRSQSSQSQSRSQGSQSESRSQGARAGGGMMSAASRASSEFNREEAIETLNNLLVADYDAIGLYERVIQNLDNERFRSVVEGFRGDHERHVRELTESIRALGGEPMTRPSLMGPIGKVVASIASTLMGNKGALQALMQGEQYTNATYGGAPITNFPDELRELVVRNSQDEQRHLQWVTETLKNM